jgi:hypothetical protein
LKLFFLLIFSVYSQDWGVYESKYFHLEFPKSQVKTAKYLYALSDTLVVNISNFFNYDLKHFKEKPIRIIFSDSKDVSNGFAIDNNIVIYAESSHYLDSWTNDYAWYERVLAHELIHHFMFRLIKRGPQSFGLAFQYLTSDMPPRWFSEGLAQFLVEKWDYFRSEKRLKEAFFDNSLSYGSMHKNLSISYAAGHAFIRFLADKYGLDKLKNVLKHEEGSLVYSFHASIQASYKKSIQELYLEFYRSLAIYYGYKYQNFSKDTNIYKPSYPEYFETYRLEKWSDKNLSFVFLARENSTDRFTKLIIADSLKNKIFLDENVLNFSVDTTHKIIFYNKVIPEIVGDELYTRSNWYLYNHDKKNQELVIKNVRSKYSIIDYPNIIFVEQKDDGYDLVKYDIYDKTIKRISFDYLSIGKIYKYQDLILVEGQNKKTGSRAIYSFIGESLVEYLNDEEVDNRNLIEINNDTVKYILNQISNSKMNIAVVDINNEMKTLSFYEDYELELYDREQKELYLKHNLFGRNLIIKIPISELNKINEKIIDRQSFFDFKSPLSKKIKLKERNEIALTDRSIFNFDHFLTLGFPYPIDGDYGLFALNILSEPLDRFRSLLIMNYNNKNKNDSFIFSEQKIRQYGLEMRLRNVLLPKIFSVDRENYLKQWKTDLSVSKRIYLSDPIKSIIAGLTVSRDALFFKNRKQTVLGLSGHIQYKQQQFFVYDDFIPSRLFSLQSILYKGYIGDKNMSFFKQRIESGYEFFQSFYSKTLFQYSYQDNSNSELLYTGIDKYYQYEIPKDILHSSSIRGFNRNMFSNNLFWVSTELKYFLLKNSTFKALFVPLNKVSLDLFLDYARLMDKGTTIYSYGYQLSFLYPSFELQTGKWHIDNENNWYFRLKLNYDIQ